MDPDDDLACGCPTALPALAGVTLGLVLTAGWVARVAWTVAHNPEALAWVRSAR